MIDTTYKLEKKGLLLLIAGIKLHNGIFNLIACALSTEESARSYSEFLVAIKTSIK